MVGFGVGLVVGFGVGLGLGLGFGFGVGFGPENVGLWVGFGVGGGTHTKVPSPRSLPQGVQEPIPLSELVPDVTYRQELGSLQLLQPALYPLLQV